MEYQNIINLLDNTPNQSSIFRTKNWVAANDDSRETYSVTGQTKFKTSMLRSRLCDYSNVHIVVSGTIIIIRAGPDDSAKKDKRDKWVIFTNCAPICASSISEIDSTQVDYAQEIDVVMPIYNLIKSSDNIWKFMTIL